MNKDRKEKLLGILFNCISSNSTILFSPISLQMLYPKYIIKRVYVRARVDKTGLLAILGAMDDFCTDLPAGAVAFVRACPENKAVLELAAAEIEVAA